MNSTLVNTAPQVKSIQSGQSKALPYDDERKGIPVAVDDRSGTKLAAVLLGATSTLIFSAADNYTKMQITVSNNSGVARTFELHLWEVGESADSNTNLICTKGRSLSATGPARQYVDLEMKTGQKLYGLCDSANGVTVLVTGVRR
jgi:hypothetical protein